MNRIIVGFVTILALAASAAAEFGYDYPAEYAGLFEDFTPIRPEEAQMLVSAEANPPGSTDRAGIILEPIIFRTISGTPAYYVIISYHGGNAKIREQAENIIGMLNDEAGFDPVEVNNKYEVINEFKDDFSTFVVYVWPWHRGIAAEGHALTVFVLMELKLYSDTARDEFGSDYLNTAYLYATALGNDKPIIAFENSGEDIQYVLGSGEVGSIGDVKDLERAGFEKRLAASEENISYFDESQKKWLTTRERIKKDAVKENGCFILIDNSE